MFRLYAMVGVVLFIVGVAGVSTINRATNYTPAKASVFLIDRKCDIIETETGPDGHKSSRAYNGECKSADDAWDKAKSKHDDKISGRATVKVTYIAPKDGSSQTSELHFTARDDEFYELKAGDEINILVRNDDPTQIIKA